MFEEITIQIGESGALDLEFGTKVSVSPSFHTFSGSLDICVDVDEKIEDVITEQNIKDAVEYVELCYVDIDEDCPYREGYWYLKELLAKKDFSGILSKCRLVKIDGTYDEIIKFLQDNKFLIGKTIVINKKLDVNYDAYLEVKKYFGEYPNIEFLIEGNYRSISFFQYEKTVLAIKEIVDSIKTFDYSPLEQALYAYDLVRNRFYVMEEEDEDYAISRDLSSVLFGDKIVCAGFANIYNAILHMLGFNTSTFILISNVEEGKGHARVFAYIKDDKYSIDGLYFFDPTFDCKKDDSNSFLESYRFFARTKDQMELYDRGRYTYKTYDLFDSEDVYEWEEEHPQEYVSITNLLGKVSLANANKMARMLGKKPVEVTNGGISKEQVVDLLLDGCTKADKPIGSQVFLEALYRVRRNQYYIDPTKYVFDMNTLTNILVRSKLVCDLRAEDRLLAAIFGSIYTVNSLSAEEIISKFSKEHDLETDMERIKLIRTLRTVLDTREAEEDAVRKVK